MGKLPFSFRINNLCHPLYLGAEDEREFKTWTNVLKQVIQQLETTQGSKTDEADIRTNKDIDFSVQVINEVTHGGATLAECKVSLLSSDLSELRCQSGCLLDFLGIT